MKINYHNVVRLVCNFIRTDNAAIQQERVILSDGELTAIPRPVAGCKKATSRQGRVRREGMVGESTREKIEDEGR